MPLLNTKSLLQIFLQNLKHDRQLQYQEEGSITHNTNVLPGKHKAKNPTIIYYVYIMDHETISYKNIIQYILVQYTIVSHCHTKIDKFMCQFTASRQPTSYAQSSLMEIPAMKKIPLSFVAQSSWAHPLCVWLHECTH
jgi:hypothetical protein